MDRILILRGGALGDFIVTLPALAALRARWPAARIEFAGNAIAARLALTRGLLDAIHSQHESRWAALYSGRPLPADFAAWLARFDLVLAFWPDPAGDLARHFPFSPAQTFLFETAQPATAPAAAHFCAPLRGLGLAVPPDQLCFQFSLPKPGQFRTDAPGSPQIAIHPGSGSPTKNWPLERWLKLCSQLKTSHDAEFLIITGEAEPAATRDAFAHLGRSAHALPLEELIVAIASCRLFLGHDSGVSHLAAACGVPSVLLFGPTDPATWAPPAPHVSVIRQGETLLAISVSDVESMATHLLAAQK